MKKKSSAIKGLGIVLTVSLLSVIAILWKNTAPPPWERQKAGLFCWESNVITDSSAGELLFETMEDQGLQILYQSVSLNVGEQGVRDFLSRAAIRDLEVWLLTGDPRWGLDADGSGMVEAVRKAAAYNEGQPEEAAFHGVMMDCEPYLLPEWDLDAGAVMDRWLSALKAGCRAAEEAGIAFVACIPYYLDTEGFSEQLRALTEEGCHGLAVMNYYRENEAAHIQNEVAFARAAGIPVTVIYELQPPDGDSIPEESTYYRLGLPAVERSWEALMTDFGKTGFSPALHEYEALLEVTGHE